MGPKRYARDPLLYIHQPKMQMPEAQMQHQYYTPRQSRQARPDVDNVNNHKQKRNRTTLMKRDYFDESDDEEWYEMETLKEDTKTKEDTKPKSHSFKDMTLIEKVHYFVNVPEHLPKIKCIVETADNRYRGIITDFKDNIVYMKTGKRMLISNEIPFEDIKSIQMIGF